MDNDTSAYSGAKRHAYDRMVDDVRRGRITTVLAWHNDRLHRSPKELEAFIDLINDTSAQVHFVTSGEFDLSTPTGRMIARQVGVLARYESEHKSERITRAHRQGAELGKYRGGSARIFGYNDDGYTLNAVEAEAIRGAYQAILEGKSAGSILRDWKARGLTSTQGRPFIHTTLRSVLLRKRNYGVSEYKGEIVGVGQWEPIVDEATFKQVEGILNDPGRIKNKSNRAKYLMSGLLLCGKCEQSATMGSYTASQKGVKVRYYRCRSCLSNFIRIDETDAFVAQLVIARLSQPDSEILAMPRAEQKADDDDLEAKARILRARLTELVDMYATGEITRAQHQRAAEAVKTELSAVEARMSTTPGRTLVGELISSEDIEQAWANLDIAQRKELVSALVTITVKPVGKGYVRRYQPERLEIEWT